MSLPRLVCKLGVLCFTGALALALAPAAFGGIFYGCCHEPCPPCYVHCQEGHPRIRIKCGCPKPVCDPCDLEHFGYYPTCWQPWPYPPDWSHCPVPPPGAVFDATAGLAGPGAPMPRSVGGQPERMPTLPEAGSSLPPPHVRIPPTPR